MNLLLANINISLSFKSIAYFVLWVLLVAVLLFLVLILIRTYRTLKKVMKLIDEKRNEVDQVIDELPIITKNVTTISTEIAHGMEAFHDTVDNVAHTSENVSGAIADKSDGIGKISSLMHTVSIIQDLYNEYFVKKDDEETQVMVCTPVDAEDINNIAKSKNNKKIYKNGQINFDENDDSAVDKKIKIDKKSEKLTDDNLKNDNSTVI